MLLTMNNKCQWSKYHAAFLRCPVPFLPSVPWIRLARKLSRFVIAQPFFHHIPTRLQMGSSYRCYLMLISFESHLDLTRCTNQTGISE